MRSISALLIYFMLILAGCMTARVATDLDLNTPLSITVYQYTKEFIPTEENERVLEDTIRFWLPHMREASTTYPTSQYRLRVKGKNKDGEDYESLVFVGPNWIGDGRGVVTLADTQAFKLHMAITETIANK